MIKKLLCALFLLCSVTLYAQEEQREKTPEELAAAEIKVLTDQLDLSQSQIFYVDSIMLSTFTNLDADIKNLRASGMQNVETYRAAGQKHLEACKKALQLVLDEQQYIKYLKYIGQGKEYKKGKDGKYYKKEELKKKKSSDK